MPKRIQLAIKRLEAELQWYDPMTTSIAFLVFMQDIRMLIEYAQQRRKK